jgi:hypothetical protein
MLVVLLGLTALCASCDHRIRSLDDAQTLRHVLNRLPDVDRPPQSVSDGAVFVDRAGLAWTKLPRLKSLFHHPNGLLGSLRDLVLLKPERYLKFDSPFRNSNGMFSSYEATWDTVEHRWVHEDASFNLCAPNEHRLCHLVVDVVDYLVRADQQLPTVERLAANIGKEHPDLAHVLERWHVDWLFKPVLPVSASASATVTRTREQEQSRDSGEL